MAFVTGSHQGALNGTAEVTLVPAPGAGTRRLVRTVVVHVRDTAPVVLTVAVAKGAGRYRLAAQTLQPGDTWNCTHVLALDAADESVVASLAAPPATFQPDFNVTYGDETS